MVSVFTAALSYPSATELLQSIEQRNGVGRQSSLPSQRWRGCCPVPSLANELFGLSVIGGKQRNGVGLHGHDGGEGSVLPILNYYVLSG